MTLLRSTIGQGVYTALLLLICLTPSAKASESTEGQFHRLAQRLLSAPPLGADYHRIQLYPINEYTPEVHRRLQVAANLCAAFQTNEVAEGEPIFPLVFRPLFRAEAGAIYLTGFQEVTNAAFADNPWVNLENPSDRSLLINETVAGNANIYGQPVILSVNQHWPNFNEFEVKHDLVYYRKLEARKNSTTGQLGGTNAMIGFGLSNRVAIEFWNPSTNNIDRQLVLSLQNFSHTTLNNEKGGLVFAQTRTNILTTTGTWSGNQFQIPLFTNCIQLTNVNYHHERGLLTGVHPSMPNGVRFTRLSNIPSTPVFQLITTNTLVTTLVDIESGRLIDFVNLHNLGTDTELSGSHSSLTSEGQIIRLLWETNLVSEDGLTEGMLNQIQASLGNSHLSPANWADHNQDLVDQNKAVDLFRVFCGLDPLVYPREGLLNELGNTIAMATPFSPARKFTLTSTFQANDPLIHGSPNLLHHTNQLHLTPPRYPETNSNIGLLNESYTPWLGRPDNWDTFFPGIHYQDPLRYSADHWDFPRLQSNSLKGLGQIHRGTPWQSLYLKSIGTNFSLRNWERWSNAPDTHPSNDYHLVTAILPEFTGLTNETRIALNEPNPELWRSAFNGITVLTNTVPTNAIVSKYTPLNFEEITLTPDMPQVESLLAMIAEKRATSPNGLLAGFGDLLNVSELSLNSPFLNTDRNHTLYTITDEAYERLTEALLERVRPDHAELNLAIENGQARLHMREFFAAGYTVQWSSNLVDWINLTNNLPPNAVVDLQSDTEEAAQKFYRVVR